MHKTAVAALVLAALGSTACRDTTAAEDRLVTVRFSTGTGVATGGDSLVVTGTNGTLRIHDVRFVVSGLALERAGGSCTARDDGCAGFAGGPFLVDLPLDGSAATLTTGAVGAGSYTSMVFEVEGLDGDDAGERQALQPLLARLRQTYPDAPHRSSMAVRGVFVPTTGTALPFTVYLDTEVRVRPALASAVEVPGPATLTVHVDPASWFRSGAEVVNLAALDGRTLSLQVAHGFTAVRVDD